MNATVELEKEKMQTLNKIDISNKENQQKKQLEEQRRVYESQNEFIKKQLEHVVQMNQFAEDVQKSSGSIQDLVSKIA